MSAPRDCSHFIPLLTSELVELLCADRKLPEGDRERLRELAGLVQEVNHRHFHHRLIELKNAYAPFDPDSDAAAVVPLKAEQKQHCLNGLLRDLAWLLDRAHFRHLDRKDIEPSLREASEFGIRMQVDFSAFEHVALFIRGEAYQARTLRSWKTLFREKEVEVPIFRRLVLVLKLREHPRLRRSVETDQVYIKLFKDIPRADVDMLLPGARVKLNLLDRGKIGVGFLSGMGIMAFKMLEDLHNLLFHGTVPTGKRGLLFLWGIVAGLAGYVYKSYFDYLTTRQAYHLNLTQSLYFQNLDGNAGVLTRLFDEAEEQETRTTLLAYFSLLRHAGEEGLTTEELESTMELYLDRYAEVTLLCETGEPVQKLARLGLVERAGERFRAVPLPRAIAALYGYRDRAGGVNGVPSPQSKQPV